MVLVGGCWRGVVRTSLSAPLGAPGGLASAALRLPPLIGFMYNLHPARTHTSLPWPFSQARFPLVHVSAPLRFGGGFSPPSPSAAAAFEALRLLLNMGKVWPLASNQKMNQTKGNDGKSDTQGG